MNFEIQHYSVYQYHIQKLLTWMNSGKITIPKIWQPFVWSAAKVCDPINSMYFGNLKTYIGEVRK